MTDRTNRPRTAVDYVRLFFVGAAMGTADVIPGVSGGTMAFILGIYEELLAAIKSFNMHLLRLVARLQLKAALDAVPWKFLVALGSGLLTAVFTLAHLVSWLLDNQPVYLFAFFFGLILASILAIGITIRWSPTSLVSLAIGTVAAYLIVGLVPISMPHDPITLFLSGAVAIMAMILPGISGAFILLILGQYAYVLEAVRDRQLLTILPVALGAVIGLMSFARVLSWLLNRYHQATIAVLVGFMIGSLRRIWPWKETLETTVDRHGEVVPLRQANILPDFGSSEFLVALALCLLGFVLVSALEHAQSGANPLFKLVGISRRRESDMAAAE